MKTIKASAATGDKADVLATNDIRTLLENLAAAIRLDQRRVDALPASEFHPQYDASMWASWRVHNLAFIDKLSATTDQIPDAVLTELTAIARTRDPVVISTVLLEQLAEAASGSVDESEFLPAGRFFEWLIRDLQLRPPGIAVADTPVRQLIALWFSALDPLRIAADPECGYSVLTKERG